MNLRLIGLTSIGSFAVCFFLTRHAHQPPLSNAKEAERDAPPPPAAALVKLDLKLFPAARCLDGSPGAYYIRNGSRSHSWVVVLEGGGFCGSFDECSQRAMTDLGSSSQYPRRWDFSEPYLSTSAADNPLLHDWNVAYARYCDGAYFAGRAGPTWDGASGRVLSYEGEKILRSIVADLAARRPDFRSAAEILVAGCSAGGIAVMNQLDGIAELLRSTTNPTVRIRGFSDSGFYLAKPVYIDAKRYVVEGQHAGGLVPPACLAKHVEDPWICFVAEVGSEYLRTPVFMWQSRYDADQLQCEMDENCRANATCVEAYGKELQGSVVSAVAKLPDSAAFIDACEHHCWPYDGPVAISVDGHTPPQALAAWFNHDRQRQPPEAADPTSDSASREEAAVVHTSLYIQQGTYPCPSCCTAAVSAKSFVQPRIAVE